MAITLGKSVVPRLAVVHVAQGASYSRRSCRSKSGRPIRAAALERTSKQ